MKEEKRENIQWSRSATHWWLDWLLVLLLLPGLTVARKSFLIQILVYLTVTRTKQLCPIPLKPKLRKIDLERSTRLT